MWVTSFGKWLSVKTNTVRHLVHDHCWCNTERMFSLTQNCNLKKLFLRLFTKIHGGFCVLLQRWINRKSNIQYILFKWLSFYDNYNFFFLPMLLRRNIWLTRKCWYMYDFYNKSTWKNNVQQPYFYLIFLSGILRTKGLINRFNNYLIWLMF